VLSSSLRVSTSSRKQRNYKTHCNFYDLVKTERNTNYDPFSSFYEDIIIFMRVPERESEREGTVVPEKARTQTPA
jgi:hypothetical protein